MSQGLLVSPAARLLGNGLRFRWMPLRVANRFHADLYRWHVLSADGGPVLASNGNAGEHDGALEPLKKGDLLFVVAGFEPLRAVTPALVRAAQARSQRVTLGGIDTGSVVLAEAGLLDGRRATLHWEAIDAFQESYPQLSVTQELFEIDGPRITSAGGTAYRPMLDLIAQAHGPQLAVQVSSSSCSAASARARPPAPAGGDPLWREQPQAGAEVIARWSAYRAATDHPGAGRAHPGHPPPAGTAVPRAPRTTRPRTYLGLRLEQGPPLLRQTDLRALQVSGLRLRVAVASSPAAVARLPPVPSQDCGAAAIGPAATPPGCPAGRTPELSEADEPVRLCVSGPCCRGPYHRRASAWWNSPPLGAGRPRGGETVEPLSSRSAPPPGCRLR